MCVHLINMHCVEIINNAMLSFVILFTNNAHAMTSSGDDRTRQQESRNKTKYKDSVVLKQALCQI